MTLLMTGLVTAWLPGSSIEIPPENFKGLLPVFAFLVSLYLPAVAIAGILRRRSSRLSHYLRNGADRVAIVLRVTMIFLLFASLPGLYTYLAASTKAPLLDPTLAAIDRSLGFDWLTFLDWINAYPRVCQVLIFAYHATIPLLPVMVIGLALANREGRAMELLALFSVSLLLTGLVMAMVPAAGAYAHFQPSRERFSNLTAQAGMWHYRDLLLLRSGAPFVFRPAEISGIVTFPSFHTVIAVITAYSVRGLRFVFIPVATLNLLMIVSTLPEGGHHLVDVLAGLFVACVSIVIVRTLCGPAVTGNAAAEPSA